MKITIIANEQIFTLDVASDMELENFKALCSIEIGVDKDKLAIMHDGKLLRDDKQTLIGYGVKENDVLLVEETRINNRSTGNTGMNANFDFGSIRLPLSAQSSSPSSTTTVTNNSTLGANDAAIYRDLLLSNPEQLSLLRQNNPPLANAFDKGLDEFKRVLEEQQKIRSEQEAQRVRILLSDPFDPQAQRLIDEEIRRKNIDSNMETAMEYHPESYGTVTMLYINCIVNGFPVKAFIDSGAQSTIMSKACASRCSITRLIDNRWAGIAKGVGTQKILGRIHLCQIQIEKDFLPTSFTILEQQDMDMMLGLDMLRRHQCCIDLKRNVLVIGTTGTETRFLSESEIPSYLQNIANVASKEETDNDLAAAINQSVLDLQNLNNSKKCRFPETEISELVNYGFSRDDVMKEMERCNGNKNEALAALLAKSIQMPSHK